MAPEETVVFQPGCERHINMTKILRKCSGGSMDQKCLSTLYFYLRMRYLIANPPHF